MSLHRIYILPTRSWTVLLAVLAAMWYAAISQSNSAAYLLMFFVSSLVLVTAIHAHFALAGLRSRVGRIEPVFAGEIVRLPVEVINPTHRSRQALAVAQRGQVFRDANHVAVEILEGRSSQTVELELPTRRRGVLVVDRLVLTTVYPMGFFRSWRYEPADATCLVYPLPAGAMPLPMGESFNADRVVGTAAGGDDYAGSRPYQTGESQRHVDWRAVARGQALLVKQFVGTGSRRVWLDYAETAAVGDLEARLAQLSQWIVTAERDGYTYGLRLPPFEADPARGPQHYHHCLGALAVFEHPATNSAKST